VLAGGVEQGARAAAVPDQAFYQRRKIIALEQVGVMIGHVASDIRDDDRNPVEDGVLLRARRIGADEAALEHVVGLSQSHVD